MKCGEPVPVVAEARFEVEESPASQPSPHTRRPPIRILIAIAVVVALGVGGVVAYQAKASSDRAAAAAAKAVRVRRRAADQAKRRAEIAKAKQAASVALQAVEECESKVTAGLSLDEMQRISTEARVEVRSFARSDAAEILPTFTKCLSDAADDYVLSAGVWLEQNNTQKAKYDAAWAKWTAAGYSGRAPQIDDFKDDSKLQDQWSQASGHLSDARAALQRETYIY